MNAGYKNKMMALILSISILLLYINVLNVQGADPEQSVFSNFMAMNGSSDMGAVGGLVWTRYDFTWNSIEPHPGLMNQSELNRLKQLVSDTQQKGISVLPVLCYSADWAANQDAYAYSYGGYTYQISPVEGTAPDGRWLRTETKTDASGNVVSKKQKAYSKAHTPFQDVNDWKAYVEEVVSIFSKPPYNVKYFQVWNEAHPNSGFYYGGFEQYFKEVHNPAAEIIRKYGCKAVYGGWPVCGSVSEYTNVITSNDAWSKIDVFDVHYFNADDLDVLYKKAVKNGVKDPCIWQTEMGWDGDKKFVANTLPRLFYWALGYKSDQPDQFKQFYYSWWSPNDSHAYGYGNTIFSGNTLSDHGKALKTINELLSGTKAERYRSFTSLPELSYSMEKYADSIQVFALDGKKLVAAVNLMNKTAISSVSLVFNGVKGVREVRRVDMFGNMTSLPWTEAEGGRIKVDVPTADEDVYTGTVNGTKANFYVVVNADEVTEIISLPQESKQGGSAEVENGQITVFSDIAGVPWAQEAIETLAGKGIIQGVAEGKFAPDDKLTRAQFITLLVKSFHLADALAVSTFSDVSKNDWYYEYAATAQKLGITENIWSDSFGGDLEINREEMAALAYRSALRANVSLPRYEQDIIFNDQKEISAFAKEGIAAMQQGGIMNGAGLGKFEPKRGTTRAEAAKVIFLLTNIGAK